MSEISKLSCLDIDEESGDVVLGARDDINQNFLITMSTKDFSDRAYAKLSDGGEVIAVQAENMSGYELDFFYETYAITKSSFDIAFSMEISEFQDAQQSASQIDKLLLFNKTSEQTNTDVFVPNTTGVTTPSTFDSSVVKLDVWANDKNGISAAQLSTLTGYLGESGLDLSSASLLPVFSWDVAPLKEQARLLIVDDRNNITAYLLSINGGITRSSTSAITKEKSISAANNPLAKGVKTSIVGGRLDQHFYVSNESSCIKVNTDTFKVLSYFENSVGATVAYKSADGMLWGLAQPSGKVYMVLPSSSNVDIDAILYDYHHQEDELRQSASSASSSSSSSSIVVFSSSQSSPSSSLSSVSSISSSSKSSSSTKSNSSQSSDYYGETYREIASINVSNVRIERSVNISAGQITLPSPTVVRKVKFTYGASAFPNWDETSGYVQFLAEGSNDGIAYTPICEASVRLGGFWGGPAFLPRSGTILAENSGNATAYAKYRLRITGTAEPPSGPAGFHYITIGIGMGISH